jgi:hypothetical protein
MAQNAPTLDSDALSQRFRVVEFEYPAELQSIASARPQPPNTDAFIYPRYRELSQGLTAALRTSRILSLNEPLDVVQRMSPTFVIAASFDAPATGLRFCDNDICKYTGRIFVHLRQASVANKLTPGWLRYDGLRSYTTILGAPDTIPEFSQVALDDYPSIASEQRALRNFKPSNGEQKQYAEPIYQRYNKNVNAYYAKLFQLDADHLKKRLDLVQQIATPLLGVKIVMVEFNGLRPMHVPEPMVESLQAMVDATMKYTNALTQEIGEMLGSKDEGARRRVFLQYTEAWIRSTEGEDCSNHYPNSERPTQPGAEGKLGAWERVYGVWSVNASYQPWCTLRSWTRLEIPRLDADGKPVEPGWWRQFQENASPR